ncbi:macro domain-containing protein [Haloarcula sp. S1CR25-12]|uniref:Macro domain-containing protein n=1 Tax=Haloarcula saliterrae TaxID=2950534 RepID=A0ABU2FH23_9EURY|nr:macro domain-containing protein [Haloarcula sp. S1CR25-12]MDS0261036.1 macro domain-containing protein [Haloarcula sp. S1CR25-12]
MRTYRTIQFPDIKFSLVYDDIAEQEADFLVSAAETNLQMRGAVAEALRSAGGESHASAAQSESPVPLGEVAVTDACDLDAEYVIHAAATPSLSSQQASAASIRGATRSTLSAADELDGASLVIPVIGTETAGFEFKEGTHIVCEVVREHDTTTLDDVRIITNSEKEFSGLTRIAAMFYRTCQDTDF